MFLTYRLLPSISLKDATCAPTSICRVGNRTISASVTHAFEISHLQFPLVIFNYNWSLSCYSATTVRFNLLFIYLSIHSISYELIFVAASHQTGLDTRSLPQSSILVGNRGRGGRARAEAQALVTMIHLAHTKVPQPKPEPMLYMARLRNFLWAVQLRYKTRKNNSDHWLNFCAGRAHNSVRGVWRFKMWGFNRFERSSWILKADNIM